MDDPILIVEPFSCNDIPVLAELIEVCFDYFSTTESSYFADYLNALRTVTGLGLTSVLVSQELLLPAYYFYFNQFLEQNEGDFKTRASAKRLIAHSMARMVALAVTSFRSLNYPHYYRDFVKSLYYLLVPGFIEERDEARQILAKFQMSYLS